LTLKTKNGALKIRNGALPPTRTEIRDGNGYPSPAYPPGKYPLDVRVWDKKIPIGIQMGKIYTHQVERVWVWDQKLIPIYPDTHLIV
jgi:hypothetical protein